jgi:hypothetical protein
MDGSRYARKEADCECADTYTSTTYGSARAFARLVAAVSRSLSQAPGCDWLRHGWLWDAGPGHDTVRRHLGVGRDTDHPAWRCAIYTGDTTALVTDNGADGPSDRNAPASGRSATTYHHSAGSHHHHSAGSHHHHSAGSHHHTDQAASAHTDTRKSLGQVHGCGDSAWWNWHGFCPYQSWRRADHQGALHSYQSRCYEQELRRHQGCRQCWQLHVELELPDIEIWHCAGHRDSHVVWPEDPNRGHVPSGVKCPAGLISAICRL